MATTTISSVFSELFEAPMRAATEAESRYRAIWADWIGVQEKLFAAAGVPLTPEAIDKILDLAPVMKVDGFIDVAITMRIAEVRERSKEVAAGIQLSVVQASGKYSSFDKSAQESIFQASTRFSISNSDANLRQFLTDRGLVPADPKDLNLKKIIEVLRTDTTSKPADLINR